MTHSGRDMVGAAMHDAVADRRQSIAAKMRVDERQQCVEHGGESKPAVAGGQCLLRAIRAVGIAGEHMRCRISRSSTSPRTVASTRVRQSARCVEQRELHAGRTGVQRKDRSRSRSDSLAGPCHQHAQRAGCQARARAIGAAGQDDRHAGAQHDARRVGAARKVSCLASMLPASRSGTSRMSARPATGETMPFSAAAASLTALSKASGPSSTPPVIWPRSAILHSAAASSVEGIRALTISTAARIATRGCGNADHMREIDGVLHDVGLVRQRRRDVDGGVRQQQRARIVRHVHQIDMADPPRSCAGRSRVATTGVHQLVGVQIAFHQQGHLAGARQRDRLRCGGAAVRRVDQAQRGDVRSRRLGHRPRSGPSAR